MVADLDGSPGAIAMASPGHVVSAIFLDIAEEDRIQAMRVTNPNKGTHISMI